MVKPDIYYRNAAKQWIIRAKDDILWTENNILGKMSMPVASSQNAARAHVAQVLAVLQMMPEVTGLVAGNAGIHPDNTPFL